MPQDAVNPGSLWDRTHESVRWSDAVSQEQVPNGLNRVLPTELAKEVLLALATFSALKTALPPAYIPRVPATYQMPTLYTLFALSTRTEIVRF
jgi:hypothetical protein